jgi:hypothetical protein
VLSLTYHEGTHEMSRTPLVDATDTFDGPSRVDTAEISVRSDRGVWELASTPRTARLGSETSPVVVRADKGCWPAVRLVTGRGGGIGMRRALRHVLT